MKILLFILFCLHSMMSFSQEELEEYFIPPATSIFSATEEDLYEGNALGELPAYSIRWCFTTMARKLISFEYEKSIGEKMSIGLIGGYCLGKDFIQTGTSAIGPIAFAENGETVTDILETAEANGGGMVFGAYLRTYFNAFSYDEQNFLEFQIRNSSYGYKYDNLFDGQLEIFDGRFSNTLFALLFGHQTYHGAKETFVYDKRIGLGINVSTYDSFSLEYQEQYYSSTLVPVGKQKTIVPMLYFSMAIGYAKFR
jgi:hypothetical protein